MSESREYRAYEQWECVIVFEWLHHNIYIYSDISTYEERDEL